MPVETEYLEHGIVLIRWLSEVTMDELFASQAQGIALINEHGLASYILIIDMVNGDIRHIDIRGFWRIVNNRDDPLSGTVIFGASSPTQLIGNTIGKAMGIKVVFCKDSQEALATARRLLAAYSP